MNWCGDCKYLEDSGYMNWGDCYCPLPRCIDEGTEIRTIVWIYKDGEKVLETCNCFKKNTNTAPVRPSRKDDHITEKIQESK